MEDKATKDLLAIMADVAKKIKRCEYVTAEYETLVKLYIELYRFLYTKYAVDVKEVWG